MDQRFAKGNRQWQTGLVHRHARANWIRFKSKLMHLCVLLLLASIDLCLRLRDVRWGWCKRGELLRLSPFLVGDQIPRAQMKPLFTVGQYKSASFVLPNHL